MQIQKETKGCINMLSQVTTCMEHLANNQLPCIPLFRIRRGGSASSSSYLSAVLHSGIKLSPVKL